LTFDSDFDEIFGDFDIFSNRFMKRFQGEIDEIFKEIKNGKIKGTFETREINEPGVKGYIIQGRFGLDHTSEPLEPLKPSRRRPLPEKPFELPEGALKKMREPLTDIFEEENATKIYVELPGEEKEDIVLKVTEDSVEVKAKSFCKMIKLPNRHIAKETVSSKYKNGMLEITIPKKTELRKKDAEEEKAV
jgi:HSP20 family molecular chaperone IbpA